MNQHRLALERAAPWLCGTVVILAVLVNMSRDFPFVGHDFAWCMPRLLDTDLHLRINGLTVQWYTPSFGGGLPAFANPQHFEYSLLQAMLYLTSPWVAVLLTTAIVSAVGYAACVAILSGTLGLAPIPSALGGVFFIGNGFYIEHLIAGHVNYQLFPLGALLLYVLINGALSPLTRGCIAALCVAMVVHHGSPLLLILTAGSIVLAAQVIYLIDRSGADWRGAFTACAIGAPLSLALVASKVFAVQSLMRQFPREVTDRYPVNALHGLAGLGAQLVGGMTIIPALLLAGRPPQQVDGALVRMTGAPWRVWEVDTGLSPVLVIVLLIGVAQFVASIRKRGLPRVPPGARLIAIALALSCWIAIEATLAKGVIYPALRTLPILRSLHVNTRFAVVFILPLTIAGATLLHRWYRTTPPQWQVAALLGVSLAAPWIYLVLPATVHVRSFDMTPALKDHARAKRGEQFPISRIDDVYDIDTIATGASSTRPNEALFGYFLEVFEPRIHIGSIYDQRDGRLNMTNPSSLVFPEFYDARPFDLIRADDRINLERLANRRQPDWPMPPILHRLNVLAVATLAGCVAVAGLGLFRRSSRRFRP